MSELVVVSLIGNLGNQLFQFAAAKGMQDDPGEPVIVDDRLSMEWPNRLPTALASTAFRPARQGELLRLRQVPRVPRGQRTLNRWREVASSRVPALRLGGREAIEGPSLGFDRSLLDRRPPLLLRGYFQSEDYFASVADSVRGSFLPPSAAARATLEHLTDALGHDRPLVGVSLRTGSDYQHFDMVLPASYYRRAIRSILDRLGAASFVVFGDVPRDCARFADVIADTAPAASVADGTPTCQLHLMAMLPHLILSNSTFAWWGAWLGDASGSTDDRIVIVPEPWWTGEGDTAPHRWTRLQHDGLTGSWTWEQGQRPPAEGPVTGVTR